MEKEKAGRKKNTIKIGKTHFMAQVSSWVEIKTIGEKKSVRWVTRFPRGPGSCPGDQVGRGQGWALVLLVAGGHCVQALPVHRAGTWALSS